MDFKEQSWPTICRVANIHAFLDTQAHLWSWLMYGLGEHKCKLVSKCYVSTLFAFFSVLK